ncbi:MAG: ABC-type transporter, integral rane subunit [Spirochaeta sp.]|jgi:multiple sugar transport system permease protein|uniref:carbohydrate ABC transporter permease n=1 Tax=Sphaerochaeta TaxID=399320 RepID=UPI001369B08A|nr:carbohydrate ABC transporter permease [Sphaerochaeta halotolerans]MBZ4673285.1 ABC-type transporter, integral rane subunit [Spirochaeta sp.]MDN5334140.1 multiple sugar transport system permease protein [Sphaerochaeta sp.]MXI87703.1 ABC transporter permease subunit [Sphaerochaeta halotolerans]
MNRKYLKQAPYALLVVLLTILFVYPFWWMVVNSLNSSAEIFGVPKLLPTSWAFSNYHDIFTVQPFARHYLNTLAVAFVGTAGNVLLAALAGYAFARMRFPLRNAAFLLLLTALMMPIEVTIIPLFFQMQRWGALDTLVPLMLLPIFGSQGAFSTFMLRQFYVTVPNELEEAARIDGLNPLGIFLKIMLPVAVPVLSSVAILAFIAVWNTYLEPLVFISSLENFTLPLSLTNFNDTYGLPQWHLQLAATTLSILPIMVVYLLFQQKVSDAMVNTGLK